MKKRSISIAVFAAILSLTASVSDAATVGKVRPPAPPLPVTTHRLTKLRFTIDSTSDWATIDLTGGSLYTQGTPVVTGGVGGPYSTTGFFLQTAGTAHLVVDVVYDLPAKTTNLQVCKNTDGVTSVRIDRITDTPKMVANLVDTRADGVWVGNCADPANQALKVATLAPAYSWPKPVDSRKLTLGLYTPWNTPAFLQAQPFVDKPFDPSDGSTQAGVNGMVNQAADSGVNGFVYWHNGDPESQRRYDLVMRAAEQRPGFTVAGELDLGMLGGFQNGTVTVAGVEAWTRSLLARASSPSYLRVGDRPVLFVWGTQFLPVSVWTQAIADLHATGLNPFVVADGFDNGFGFDGYWLLNPNNVADAALPAWYDNWMKAAKVSTDRALGATPTLWAAGISPGEDDTYSGKPAWMWWQAPRNNGTRYDKVWQAAAATNPEWMVVSTWNDFQEATYIQPSQKLGSQALTQTKAWASWFAQH